MNGRRAKGSITGDRRGIVLLYVALALPAIIGLALLAIDASRLYGLHTSLQQAADALALAGAAELDRKTDSITRADAAVAHMVKNGQLFGEGTQTISAADVSTLYLTALPASDATPINPAANYVITDKLANASKARFIYVVVKPKTLNTIFPASFLGGLNTAKANASAVAGSDAAVCNFTPLFMCNPYETYSKTIYQVVADPAEKRKLLELKRSPGTSAGGASQTATTQLPGNFGFLDPDGTATGSCTGGGGANAIKSMLAAEKPAACFIANGVCMQTGNIASVISSVNQRFDIYPNGNKTTYPPAANVRKGYKAGTTGKKTDWCNATVANDPVNYPYLFRDSCYTTNSCTTIGGGRMGDGNWDFNGYWQYAHPGKAKPNSWSNSNRPSRYQVYRWEIDNPALLADKSSGGETGAPQCSTATSSVDRRIIYGAILNCSQLTIKGSAGGPFPVETFAKFFMTEPMRASGTGNDDSIYVELVDLVSPGNSDSSIARDLVQLYR